MAGLIYNTTPALAAQGRVGSESERRGFLSSCGYGERAALISDQPVLTSGAGADPEFDGHHEDHPFAAFAARTIGLWIYRLGHQYLLFRIYYILQVDNFPY